ncbi:MAG: PadR family transcriptional regulator [Gemmatimonadetes bacterium]|nr:PadR family transcriptional regulator [Gemmatimonadota bacterium]
MGRQDHLGDLEELALLAVLRLGEDAYGASVRRELRKRAGRSVTVSTVYVTLMRLEEKGLVSSGLSAPTAVRGGKAKRYFRVTDAGLASLQEERAVMERMWDGLDEALLSADGHGR